MKMVDDLLLTLSTCKKNSSPFLSIKSDSLNFVPTLLLTAADFIKWVFFLLCGYSGFFLPHT